MRFAEEIVVNEFVPTARALMVRRLEERGLSQTEIAELLGVSQSAVSKHLLGRFRVNERLAAEPRLRETTARVADGLADGTMSSFEGLAALMDVLRAFENRGPICALHEEAMPALRGIGCDLCLRAGESQLREEQAALSDVRVAVQILQSTPGLAEVLPHVGTNVARALSTARDPTGVAAVPGGLFELKGTVKTAAAPEFGVSRHMSEVVLAIRRTDPDRLAALNLAHRASLLEAARSSALRIETVPAECERDPGVLADQFGGDGVPDVFHHEGAFGIEPQLYVTGRTAREAAERAQTLVRATAERSTGASGPRARKEKALSDGERSNS